MRRSRLFVCVLGSAFLLGTVIALAANPPAKSSVAKTAKAEKSAKAEVIDPFADSSPKPGEKKEKVAKSSVRRTGVEAIEAALGKPIDCEFVETPLRDVISYFQEKMQVMIYLDSASLKEAGVDESTPITINLSGLRFENVLRLILNELQLAWTIHDDVLYITSPAKAESDELMETRLYDVADLVMFQDEHGKKYDAYAPLMNIITSTIETKSWVENGGACSIEGESLGTAKILVVAHRYDVQKRIAALLAEIRTIAANKSGGDGLPRREKPTAMQSMRGGVGGIGPNGPGPGNPQPEKSGSDSVPTPNPPAKK
jgi:hypothetical protein